MSPRNQRRAHWPWRQTLTHTLSSARHERGTVLLMVVGVLALLAIIGVVYATIGRADRSAAVTVQRQQRITDQSEEIAAYIAKVIGDANFAQYVERTENAPAGSDPWKYRTRGYTYPWTDEHFLSVNPSDYDIARGGVYSQGFPALNAAAAQGGPKEWYSKFSPTGENLLPWEADKTAPNSAALVTSPDPRNHSDPYLATLEPEWLRFTAASPGGQLFNIRDWRHISNLAPSGNFVNLANLRRTNNGGFDAPPGFRDGLANIAQMSYGLTLRDRTTGTMYAPGMSFLPDGTTPANPANPAHWSNNQIFAYQPAIDSAYEPGDYRYVLNQWADTDGDGFLDARWFELTDLSSMFGANNTSTPRQLVSTRGRIRLFCAARVVDNSAKINVNVASDMMDAPWPTANFKSKLPSGNDRYLTRDNALPPGMTPADIALNRVLRLSDINLTLAHMGPGGGALPNSPDGYSGLPSPAIVAYDAQATDYANYGLTESKTVGDASYSALLSARKLGSSAIVTAGITNQPAPTAMTTAGDRFEHYDIFAADTRSARLSSLYGGNVASATNPAHRVLRSPFDLADELELSTFWGVNDSNTLSRLEATVGGRVSIPVKLRPYSPLRDNRSRALETAGRDELSAAEMFAPDNPAGTRALLAAYTDVRHLLTTVNGSLPLKDGGVAPDPAKNHKDNWASTDISAALRAIREYSELPTNSAPALVGTKKSDRDKGIQLIFKLYANALAPYTDIQEFPSAWDATAGKSLARTGMVYGGNSELALRVAAHMTANLVDAFDRDRAIDPGTGRPYLSPSSTSSIGLDRCEPTRVGLKVVQVPTPSFPGPTTTIMTDRVFDGVVTLNHNAGYANSTNAAMPVAAVPSRLPLGTAASGTSPALPSHAQYPNEVGKMTIFGIEPQPFLTEYGVLAIYTDAPRGAGGDDDAGEAVVIPLFSNSITINMTPSLVPDNTDFICEVIAFQINNPFSQDLVLYDPAGGAAALDKHKFYIELAGRYYAFRPQDVDTVAYGADNLVKLGAGKTRTFYALNPGTLKAVGERIKKINDFSRSEDKFMGATTVDQFRNLAKTWIENQLRNNGQGITDVPLQLTQMDPKSFDEILPTGGAAAMLPDMDLWGDLATPLKTQLNVPAANLATLPRSIAERRVCNLWRTVRDKSSVSTTAANDLTGNVNDLTNDILADRMHDPSDPSIPATKDGYLYSERTHGMGNVEVTGATGGDDQDGDPDVKANTGYTAIVWAAIRRPTDVITAPGVKGGTLDSAGRMIRGVLPPWCLEARSDSEFVPSMIGSTLADPFNKFGLNRRYSGSPNDQGVWTTYPGNGRFLKLKDAITSSTAVNPDIALPCFKKANGLATGARANPIGPTKETVTNYQREYSEVAVEFHDVGEDALGGAEETPNNGATAAGLPAQGIRRSRNPALFSRSGDFLLPLAVGPWFDPSRQGQNLTDPSVSPRARAWVTSTLNTSTVADREASWMTLSEALALACGYYSPEDKNDPFYEFGNYAIALGPNALHPPKADRGHLVLNAFTPHLNAASTPTYPSQPLGSGVPFALSIIDQFRAATGISSTTKQVATNVFFPEQQTRDVSYGGGSTAVGTDQTLEMLTRREGVANINTQVLTTMRCDPLLTPENDPGSFLQTANNYYAPAGGGVKLFDPAIDNDYDIAPTIIAYRDRSLMSYLQRPGVTFSRVVDFRPTAATDPTRTQKTQYGLITDRFRREALGIKSLGELAAINVPSKIAPSTLRYPIQDHNGLFRFGERDQVFSSSTAYTIPANLPAGTLGTARVAQRIAYQPSILSSRFYNLDILLGGIPDKIAPQVNGNSSAPYYALGGNELPGGYQEKLAIVNALTSTVSVRSDVFTVYFVIHGYNPDDCDVEPGQPLVPSVAKRFVMVVDRSSVLSPTDKPRILMLKEVPMQ